MNVTIVGAGAWGTALATSLSAHHQVLLYAREIALVDLMRATQVNSKYLPNVRLHENLQYCANFPEALSRADLVIVAVPMASFRSVLQAIAKVACTSGVVWLCKGFEPGSSKLPHQVVLEELPHTVRYGVLSGPSFAQEVADGMPTALTLASNDEKFSREVAQALHHARLRIYASNDVIGVEVGGAVKNVLAIAAGICDGMGLGLNARAALLTRGLAEISRLGLKLGGKSETLGGLSGVGDLILTCTGHLSRNRQVGVLLSQQMKLDTILQQLGHVAEGVYTVREVHALAVQLGVDMPICDAVFRIIYGHIPAAEIIEELLSRTPNMEFNNGC